jgi:nucleotide-binding universal stress UspA family protein
MAYQKILVAIDDSEISANVIQQAAQLAKALNSQITLVQVMTLDPYLADAYLRMGQSNELIERVRSYVQENLTKAQKQFEELGQTVATQVVEGFSVHEEIIKAAQNLEVDLIIMGSHGRTGFKSLF